MLKHPVILTLVLALLAVPSWAVYVGFESPGYTTGNALPAPWTVAGTSAISGDAPATGSQCLALANDGSGVAYARMPMYADSGSGQVIIRARMRPDSYNPGAYEAGFVTMGGMAVWNSQGSNLLGAVYFDLQKPYTVACAPQHRTIRYYLPGIGDYTFAGYWLPGQYHTLQFTYDWTKGTVELRIERPDAVVYKFTQPFSHPQITLVELAGTHLGASYLPAGWTRFDDFIYPAVPQVATPTFSPAGGVYTSAQNVTISCATTGATIRYTTNGTTPTEVSDIAPNKPIAITASTLLKAKAFKTNYTPSGVQSGQYQIVNFQPDLRVRTGVEYEYTGDDYYASTGDIPQQTKTQIVRHGVAATYLCYLQNDGTWPDTMTVTGTAGGGGWTVAYYAMGTNTDITTAMTGAGWTPTLNPGYTKGFYAKVTPGEGVNPGDAKLLTIAAVSGGDATKTDVLRCTTRELRYQPDLQLRLNAGGSYSGDNFYSADGTNQTLTQYTNSYGLGEFRLRIENDGNVTDSFRVTSQAGDANWLIAYYLLPGNANITGLVTGSGYTINNLAPGDGVDIYLQMTDQNGLAPGVGKAIYPQVRSLAEGTKKDVGKLVTRIATHQADLWVRAQGEAVYAGNNIYNATGFNQSKSLTASPALFYGYLQNDGTATEAIRLKGPAGGNGWTVAYYQMGTGSDITTAVITNTGWLTPALAPGGTQGFYVRLTPDSNAAPGAQNLLTLTALPTGDPTKLDVVKVTGVKP